MRFCMKCLCDDCEAIRAKRGPQHCENCECDNCLEWKRKRGIARELNEKTVKIDTELQMEKFERRDRRIRQSMMMWLLIGNSHSLQKSSAITTDIAFALGLTFREVNRMRAKFVKEIFRRQRDIVGNSLTDSFTDQAIRRLDAAGALGFMGVYGEAHWANPPGSPGTPIPSWLWPRKICRRDRIRAQIREDYRTALVGAEARGEKIPDYTKNVGHGKNQVR